MHLNLDDDIINVIVSGEVPAPAHGEGEGDRSTRGPTTTLNTTDHHPFWATSRGEWINAADLQLGKSTLTGPDGQITYVVGLQKIAGFAYMRDLTVATAHTYYVVAGSTPVLVHNCGGAKAGHGDTCACAAGGQPRGPDGRFLPQVHTAVIGRIDDTNLAKDWLGHEVLDDPNWSVRVNDEWVASVRERGIDVYVASNPTYRNLWDDINNRQRPFGRELDQLSDYEWNGWTMRPPNGG